ncbi:MAG: hypothetical protein U0003_05560 [Vampirovibrionales bacterium]
MTISRITPRFGRFTIHEMPIAGTNQSDYEIRYLQVQDDTVTLSKKGVYKPFPFPNIKDSEPIGYKALKATNNLVMDGVLDTIFPFWMRWQRYSILKKLFSVLSPHVPNPQSLSQIRLFTLPASQYHVAYPERDVTGNAFVTGYFKAPADLFGKI